MIEKLFEAKFLHPLKHPGNNFEAAS